MINTKTKQKLNKLQNNDTGLFITADNLDTIALGAFDWKAFGQTLLSVGGAALTAIGGPVAPVIGGALGFMGQAIGSEGTPEASTDPAAVQAFMYADSKTNQAIQQANNVGITPTATDMIGEAATNLIESTLSNFGINIDEDTIVNAVKQALGLSAEEVKAIKEIPNVSNQISDIDAKIAKIEKTMNYLADTQRDIIHNKIIVPTTDFLPKSIRLRGNQSMLKKAFCKPSGGAKISGCHGSCGTCKLGADEDITETIKNLIYKGIGTSYEQMKALAEERNRLIELQNMIKDQDYHVKLYTPVVETPAAEQLPIVEPTTTYTPVRTSAQTPTVPQLPSEYDPSTIMRVSSNDPYSVAQIEQRLLPTRELYAYFEKALADGSFNDTFWTYEQQYKAAVEAL